MLYRFAVLSMGLMLAGLVVGCGGSKAPAPAAAAAKGSGEPASDMPSIPRGAQWTILCYSISGPDHFTRARRMKNDLVQLTGLRDWYVVHGETDSTLYYGFYRTIDDANDRETVRARRDRERVVNFTDDRGDRVFQQAIFVPLDMPGDDGPAEWDLRNAEGFWTLEIGVYRDSPERRQAAVEAVRAAREMGIEAYFYHGPNASSVCIGAWPQDAIRAQQSDVAATRDPSRPIAVVPPGVNLGPNVRDAQGNPVEVFTPRMEPVDPTLIEAMQQYPHYSINGMEVGQRGRDPRTGESVFVNQPTMPVPIPRRAGSMLSGSPGTAGQAQGGAAPPPVQPRPVAPRPAQGGRLRSIDD